MLALLAQELGSCPTRFPSRATPTPSPTLDGDHGNWELSADRDAARRLMQQNGFRPDQVTQVRGYADQRLRNPKDSLDPSNRRISLIVHYTEIHQDDADDKTDDKATDKVVAEPATAPTETKSDSKPEAPTHGTTVNLIFFSLLSLLSLLSPRFFSTIFDRCPHVTALSSRVQCPA